MRGKKAKALPFRERLYEAEYVNVPVHNKYNQEKVIIVLHPECGRALYKRAKKVLT